MNWRSQQGFTLLEVILTMGILLTMSIAATGLIRTSIDLRQEVSAQAKVVHASQVAMQKITQDLQHLYFLHTLRTENNFGGRATKSLLRIKEQGGNTEVYFTTMTHQAYKKDSPEGDVVYVVYKVMPDKEKAGLSHLYRGESKVLPEVFDDEVPMQLLAKNVKTFTVLPWNGDSFVKTGAWDSERADWRNVIPPMFQVTIENWEVDTDVPDVEVDANTPKNRITTIVYVPRSFGWKEQKKGSTNLSYF